MRKWYYTGSMIVALLALLTGCSKGGPGNTGNNGGNGPHIINPQDTVPPVIELYTPTANQVFKSGNTINVTGKVSDGDGLYQGSIRITNDANNGVIADQFYVIHGINLYNFSMPHTVSVTTAANYTVTVSFEDHGLNTVTKSVKIKAEP